MLVAVTLSFYLAFLGKAYAVSICQFTFYSVPDPFFAEEVGFVVNVSCSRNNLRITWEALEEGDYQASVNYVCTDAQGMSVYGDHRVVSTEDESSGAITTNTSLDRVILFGGNCTVFGCHRLLSDVSNAFLLNKNASCSYPGTSEPTSSVPIETKPSSTAIFQSPYHTPSLSSTAYGEPTSSVPMDKKPSSTIFPSPYHTPHTLSPSSISYDQPKASGVTANQISSVTPEVLSTASLYHEISSSTTSHEHVLSTNANILPTPLMDSNSSAGTRRRNHFVTIITVTMSLIIPTIMLPVIVLAIIVFLKKKQQKKLRLKYSGSTLYIEKMDPYYAPVQIDSYLQKCESTKSIFDFLTLRADYQDDNTAHLKDEQPKEYPSLTKFNSYNHSYLLQLPPLKTHSNHPDSDYQPFTTIISPYHDQQDSQSTSYFNVQDELNTSYWQARRHVACLNMLFDGKQHYDSKNSSYCYSTSSDNTDTVQHKNSEYDVDSLVLEELEDSEGGSLSDTTQNDWNILAFPPSSDSHSYNDNVRSINESNNDDGKSHAMEEHLADSNLTINPHHFDPL